MQKMWKMLRIRKKIKLEKIFCYRDDRKKVSCKKCEKILKILILEVDVNNPKSHRVIGP